jgi:hypothetical protein
MFHPLAPNLSELSNEELNKKHGELLTKMNQAYRFGGGGVVQQMQMLLFHYTEELQRRQQQQMDEIAKQNPNFKNIIDIQ